MKRVLAIALFLLGVYFALRGTPPPESPPESPPAPPVAAGTTPAQRVPTLKVVPTPGDPVSKPAESVATTPQPTRAQAPAPAPVNPRYARKPRDFIVEFEVIDGYAVAYGDVILGKPPIGLEQPRGLTEIDRPQLWWRGPIPYVIQPDVPHPDRIEAAIQMFHQNTGVRFVQRTNQPDALVFTRTQNHCSSFLGRLGGLQPVFISEKCAAADIAHEIMHALGFVHEQSRTDRDQYVTIRWENIEPPFQGQYAMVPEALMEVYAGSPFDANSILMYGRHAFAVRKDLPTMELKNGEPVHEAPKGLSDADIERVNRLYRE